MIYTTLKRGNYKLSRIGLGAVQFGMDYGFTKAKTQGEVDAILQCCMDNGINFIDTAREYGDSEQKIGCFHSGDFVVATKLTKISAEQAGNKAVMKGKLRESIEGSLKDLKMGQLQMLALHQTEAFVTENEDFWSIVESFKKEGLFDLFGVSVYEPAATHRLIMQRAQAIDFVQLPYNALDRRFKDLFVLLNEKKIDIISRSVFLKGVLSVADEKVPSELKALESFRERLKALADQLDISVSALALSFVLRESRIASSVLGVNSADELTENVEALELTLDLQQLEEKIDELAVNDEFLIDPRKWAQL